MDINVKTTLSGKPIGNALFVNASNMKKIGNNARKRMIDRIKKGKDINDANLKSYSTQYANEKQKIGRTTTVNMMGIGRGKTKSGSSRAGGGDMLNSMRTEGKKNIASIFVTLHRLIGYYHQSGLAKGGKVREWFGATKDNTNKTIKEIQIKLSKQIDKVWK